MIEFGKKRFILIIPKAIGDGIRDYRDECEASNKMEAAQIFADRLNKPTSKDFWFWRDLIRYIYSSPGKAAKSDLSPTLPSSLGRRTERRPGQ